MPNKMIVTITMNPAIDKSAMVDKIIPEAKLHCTSVKNDPGGGGINVSKALKKLGKDSLAVFPAGGHNGNMLQDLLKKENINTRVINVDAETRENFIILETTTNNQYRFNINAISLDEKVAQQCLDFLKNLKPTPSIIVASGSLPDGIPDNFYGLIANWAKKINAKFILDTSGPPLRLAVTESVYLLKPNLSELAQLTGADKLTKEDVVDAARKIINTGNCEIMVVSLGIDGAVLVTKDFYEFVEAPKLKKLSTVGAGDSMVAGLVFMLSEKKSLQEMIRFAVACGSAATMNAGTELFHIEDVKKLYDQINCSF